MKLLELATNQHKYNAYYASGWFSEEQEENYKKITERLKEKITLFEPRYKAGELESGPMTLERAKKIFQADLDGILNCDFVFADISFRDSGVLVEIGFALAKGIPVVLFDNSTRPKMNVMLAGSASGSLRSMVDIEDFLDNQDVFNLGEAELE